MTTSDDTDPVSPPAAKSDVSVRVSMGDGDGKDVPAGSVGDHRGGNVPRNGGLTVSYEIRYVSAADGEYLAAAQAKAIAALLKWHAGCAEVGRS